MTISNECIAIFKKAIDDYHIFDSVDRELKNPFSDNQVFKKNIYKKSWIDTVQWHLEDIIRKPSIDPKEALQIKRRIDKVTKRGQTWLRLLMNIFLINFLM